MSRTGAISVLLWVALLVAGHPGRAGAGFQDRKEFVLPELPGTRMVRCDLHMHTVFSDGRVWPSYRVDEAWRDGLDCLAITDHVELQPHAPDVRPDIDRPWALARPRARELGLLLFRGAEITRSLPQGHLNAIFLKKAAALKTPRFEDAIRAAAGQGAFIFWNHPGWPQPDGVARWSPVQDKLLSDGHLNGIEVVNGSHYYPEAHRWCLQKKLTMLANSDLHDPVENDDNLVDGRRPFTIVLARDRTAAAVKQALFDRRTVIFHQDRLIGEERFLRPIFENSLVIANPRVERVPGEDATLKIRNRSSLPFRIEFQPVPGLDLPRRIRIPPQGVTRLRLIRNRHRKTPGKKIEIPFTVTNLLVKPGQGLASRFEIRFAR